MGWAERCDVIIATAFLLTSSAESDTDFRQRLLRRLTAVVDHRSDSRIDVWCVILFAYAGSFAIGQFALTPVGYGDSEGRSKRNRVYRYACSCRFTFEDLVVAL